MFCPFRFPFGTERKVGESEGRGNAPKKSVYRVLL